MLRWIVGVLLLLLSLAAASVYWLFYESHPPSAGSFPLDLTQLRKEAESLPGDGPISIEVESIYHSAVPEISMVSGAGWRNQLQVRNSYRLVYRDRSIIIDTGADEKSATEIKWTTRYDRDAWSRMQQALIQADVIIFTHEHADHIGGLLQSPNWRQLMRKALINDAQLKNRPHGTIWPSGSTKLVSPISYQGVKAVAPGVVLISAPGHSAGSQMIYVRRADGREYIFMGDAASSLDNVRLVRPRSRYVMVTGGHEDDRDEIFRQTIALNRLWKTEPQLALVPGHDAAAIRQMERQGLLKHGFTAEVSKGKPD